MLRLVLLVVLTATVSGTAFTTPFPFVESVGVVQGFTDRITVTIDRSLPPINGSTGLIKVSLTEDATEIDVFTEITTGSYVEIPTVGFPPGSYTVNIEFETYIEKHPVDVTR